MTHFLNSVTRTLKQKRNNLPKRGGRTYNKAGLDGKRAKTKTNSLKLNEESIRKAGEMAQTENSKSIERTSNLKKTGEKKNK